MTKQVRKNYTREYKIEIVKLITEEEYGLNEASIRLGISKSTLSKWKRWYGHNHKNENDKRTIDNCEKGLSLFEQQELKKELERVRRERDIIKKALAYFADPLK